MIEINRNTLTAEQKRAFQKGDKYYINPLKQYVRNYHAVEYLALSSFILLPIAREYMEQKKTETKAAHGIKKFFEKIKKPLDKSIKRCYN